MKKLMKVLFGTQTSHGFIPGVLRDISMRIKLMKKEWKNL